MLLTMKRIFSNELQKLRNYFFAGLLVVVPFGVTIWIVIGIFNFFDSWFPNLAQKYEILYPIEHGMGFLLTVALISFIGLITQMYIGRKLLNLVEFILIKIPFISTIYNGLKQVSESIMGKRNRIFESVALIEYPRQGLYSLAFVTGEDKNLFETAIGKPLAYVFVPTTPNPTSGFYLIVPQEDLIVTDLTVEEAMKMIISSGMVIPKNLYINTDTSLPVSNRPPRQSMSKEKKQSS